jgi:hypothetical protein
MPGFRGKHRKAGALGVLLKLVEEGRVPVGSVLVVEAFDGPSREDTLKLRYFFRTSGGKRWQNSATRRAMPRHGRGGEASC